MLAMLSAIYIKRQLYLQLLIFFLKLIRYLHLFCRGGKTNTRYSIAICNNMLTNVIKTPLLKSIYPNLWLLFNELKLIQMISA